MPVQTLRSKQRRVTGADSAHPVLRLEGAPIEWRDGNTYYACCTIDNETFSLQDCALLRSPDPHGPPYVCRILSIFQREDSPEGEEHVRIEVQWFFRPADTSMPRSQQTLLGPDEVGWPSQAARC
jgi:hypothetical protein